MNKYEQHLQHNIIELHCQLKLSTVDDTYVGFNQASLDQFFGCCCLHDSKQALDLGRTFDISEIYSTIRDYM